MAKKEDKTAEKQPIGFDAPSKKLSVKVRLLNKHPVDGQLTIESESGEFRLVPVEQVKYQFGWQELSYEAFSVLPKPYSFKAELERLRVTEKDLQRALYQEGIVTAEKAGGLKEILFKLLSRGKLPFIKE